MKPVSDTPLPKTVGLLSSGKVTSFTMEILAGHVQGILSLPTRVLNPFTPPEESFHAARNQYHAGILLQFLAEQPNDCIRVMGISSYDLFLPIFTHVYGEAQISGRAAVASLFRLQSGLNGHPSAQEAFLTRAAKVVLHELLHTFSLVHCRHARCLMRPVTNTEDLDRLPLYLCRSCHSYWEDCRKRSLLG